MERLHSQYIIRAIALLLMTLFLFVSTGSSQTRSAEIPKEVGDFIEKLDDLVDAIDTVLKVELGDPLTVNQERMDALRSYLNDVKSRTVSVAPIPPKVSVEDVQTNPCWAAGQMHNYGNLRREHQTELVKALNDANQMILKWRGIVQDTRVVAEGLFALASDPVLFAGANALGIRLDLLAGDYYSLVLPLVQDIENAHRAYAGKLEEAQKTRLTEDTNYKSNLALLNLPVGCVIPRSAPRGFRIIPEPAPPENVRIIRDPLTEHPPVTPNAPRSFRIICDLPATTSAMPASIAISHLNGTAQAQLCFMMNQTA